MLLRITSYAIRERTGGDFHLRTVYKDSLIEVVDLLLQFNGVVVSVAFRSKYRLMLRLVSAQHQQVGDIQKLEIKQYIFSFFACETAAQNMRNYGDIIFVLNGSSHSDSSRTSSQTVPLKQAVAEVFIYVFAAMRGDIDIFRIKLPKGIDSLIQLFDACTFQWRKDFERESCFFAVMY